MFVVRKVGTILPRNFTTQQGRRIKYKLSPIITLQIVAVFVDSLLKSDKVVYHKILKKETQYVFYDFKMVSFFAVDATEQ